MCTIRTMPFLRMCLDLELLQHCGNQFYSHHFLCFCNGRCLWLGSHLIWGVHHPSTHCKKTLDARNDCTKTITKQSCCHNISHRMCAKATKPPSHKITFVTNIATTRHRIIQQTQIDIPQWATSQTLNSTKYPLKKQLPFR